MRRDSYLNPWKGALIGVLFIFILVQLDWEVNTEKPYYFTRFAMGTTIKYTIMAPEKKRARAAMLKAHQEIERIERLFSEEDSTSEIYRFNHSEAGISTCAEVYYCIHRALDHHKKTKGAFDITIKPVLDLYPFKSDHPSPPSDGLIRKALNNVGVNKLEVSYYDNSWRVGKPGKEVGLVMGGIVKGYAVDRAIEILRANNIKNGIINAGGDLYCLGTKNGELWSIGVQHPRQVGMILETLSLSNMAVATSGDYQRYFLYEGERYHHILDPQTGKPARKAQSATIIAPTAEAADAWATALFVLGPYEGIRLVNTRADIFGAAVDSSGAIFYSVGFQHYLKNKDITN